MPDWQRMVRERLDELRIAPQLQEEVVSELASHLEDIRVTALRNGMSEPEAVAKALEEVPDWTALNQEIAAAKEGPMKERTLQLWLPGMTMLTGAAIFQVLLLKVIPPASWVQPNAPLVLGCFWLLMYVAFGALGAYWSRRAGGDSSMRMLAGAFPGALHLAIFICVILASYLPQARSSEYLQFNFQLKVFFSFVVVPGIALVAGTLPFLRERAQDLGHAVAK